MVRADLDNFVVCYRSGWRYEREDSERFRRFPLDKPLARDKANLDIFWLVDDALDDPDLLPPPDEVAAEIVERLETALASFRRVSRALIPILTDQNPCAQSRNPMDMMRHGWSMSVFQAAQQ